MAEQFLRPNTSWWPLVNQVNLAFDFHCPQCGFEYVHFGDGKTIDGNDNYDAGWGGRGAVIVIPCSCENGHGWEFCIGFHKGNTVVFCRNLHDLEMGGEL